MPQGRKHSSYMETFAMPKTGIGKSEKWYFVYKIVLTFCDKKNERPRICKHIKIFGPIFLR